MYCPKCGATNAEGTAYCIACGNPLLAAPGGVPQYPPAPPPPPSGYPPAGQATQPYGQPPYGQPPQQPQYGQPPQPYANPPSGVTPYAPGGQPGPYIPGPPPAYGQPPQPNISTYMVQSILMTLCCCLPVGIFGIINATKISKMMQSGDYQGAMKLAADSRKWLWIGLGVGLVANVLIVVVQLAAHR